MSKIPQLGKNLEKLPDILKSYEKALNGYEQKLEIKGKGLEEANREQAAWQSYFDERRVELNILLKYIEARINRTRGRLFKSYTEQHSRELSDRGKDKYIDNDCAYLAIYEIYLEVKEMHDKYNSVVEAFRSRGYALNNITKIRVAALEDVIL